MLGGGHDVGLGRVGDDDPAAGGSRDVDVVDADAGAPDHAQLTGPLDQIGRELGGRAHEDAVVLADPLGQLLVAPVDPEVDVEVLAQQIHARLADLLLDEHLGPPVGGGVGGGGAHHAILSITQSMHAVSALTSAGSTAGNMPTRSWLRPSLR